MEEIIDVFAEEMMKCCKGAIKKKKRCVGEMTKYCKGAMVNVLCGRNDKYVVWGIKKNGLRAW